MEFHNIAFVAHGPQDHHKQWTLCASLRVSLWSLYKATCHSLCSLCHSLKVAVIDSQDHEYGVPFHFLCQIESFYVNAPNTCKSNMIMLRFSACCITLLGCFSTFGQIKMSSQASSAPCVYTHRYISKSIASWLKKLFILHKIFFGGMSFFVNVFHSVNILQWTFQIKIQKSICQVTDLLCWGSDLLSTLV